MFCWPFRPESSTPSARRGIPSNPDGIEIQEKRVQEKAESARWNFASGTPIAEGRFVLKHLGGGSRYEACLVWDDRLFALMVAKILRPDQAQDPRALQELRHEAEILESLAHVYKSL